MGKEKRGWIELKLRLEPQVARAVADAAHAARLPVAVFIRKFLETGSAPKPAPPSTHELPTSTATLIKVCHGLLSNLKQVVGHADRIGGPLRRLIGNEGALHKMASEVQRIGIAAKSGGMDEMTGRQVLISLEPVSMALNFELARPLNEGRSVTLAAWKSILTDLQIALASAEMDVAK